MCPAPHTAQVNIFGMCQRDVADALVTLVVTDRGLELSTGVSEGVVQVHISSQASDAQQAQRDLDDTAAQVEEAVGPCAFGRGSQTLQGSLIEQLQQRGLTVATAESCTGGLVGKMLTDVPGSSEVYLGGWITYANEMKSQQLGVPMSLIEQYGAVSEPVARAMAQGAVQRSGAGLSVAVTGLAGPGGGSPDKPVGMVWFAVGGGKGVGGDGAIDTQAVMRVVPSDRQTIRDRTAKGAIQMLRFAVLGASLDAINLSD